MDFASLLNDKQLAAVTTTSPYVRVIAGAGSGKTRVLTYRIAYLITHDHVNPHHILAIAFTNKVAQEMSHRATELVEQVTGHTTALAIATFHAFCARFLRIEHEAIGYPANYTIYDEDDQANLVRNCAAELGYKKSDDITKTALSYIRRNKGAGRYPEDIPLGSGALDDEKTCHKIYMLYESRKTASFAFDFDDLLCQTIRLLENEDEIREHWSHRFSHILIDEFQDTNDVQYHLLRLLCTPETLVYVVGDPDQTIYTWRGANQKIILNFDRDFPNAETIILNENYRSTKTILEAANKLIAHNKDRLPKDLYTNGAKGDAITTYMGPRVEDEADWVARKIMELASQDKTKEGKPRYDNIAVLYRSSYVTRSLEQALKDRAIPYRIYGGMRFYEREEVKDLLAYFNLMYNHEDDIAFERIANKPERSVGDTSIVRIRTEAHNHNLSEYNYLLQIQNYREESNIPTRSLTALTALIQKMEDTRKRLDENLETYASVLKDFVTSIDYYEYLKRKQKPDEDRIGNVNALFDDIDHFLTSNPDSNFQEYLQNVSLLSAQDDLDNSNHVTLMTIHVAKGLEFDNVFIFDMVLGVFPSNRALSETGRNGEEEERRLAYVAMTRAKKRLFCSCNSSYSYNTDSHGVPSPYFEEAGLHLNKSGAFFSDYDWSGRSNNRYGNKPRSSYSSSWDDRWIKDEEPDITDDWNQPSSSPRAPTPKPASPKTNGISNWRVGERCHHGKFGDGTIDAVLDGNIIRVRFDDGQSKTLLGSHPMLSRIKSAGGDA